MKRASSAHQKRLRALTVKFSKLATATHSGEVEDLPILLRGLAIASSCPNVSKPGKNYNGSQYSVNHPQTSNVRL